MGAKSCHNVSNSATILGNQASEADVQIEEEFDNPSHGLQIKRLHKSRETASNNLLSQSFICIAHGNKLLRRKQSGSLSVTLKSTNFKQNETKSANKKGFLQNTRRCSIDQSFFAKANTSSENWANLILLEAQDPIKSLQEYIFTDNKLFEPYSRVQIKPQDFIKLKKTQIRKYYKFEQKIGEGSYGSVYKVKCLKSKQFRAVKSIKQKIMPQNKRNQLLIEIQILRELDHPNIIKLYEVYEDRSMYHVVTQYCVGGSIIDFVVAKKNYSQKVIRTILQQLLSAINYIHMANIVHRDLKLQNIVFLNSFNENNSESDIDIKLIDFGTATKITGKYNVLNNLVGTVSYVAPEIIDNYFNEKCDIWSTGIILYILLVGKSPFKCFSKEETLRKIKNHDLTYDQPEWQAISKEAVNLLQKMLVKDPEQRVSASQALNHKWFEYQKSENNLLYQNEDLINNLSKYYRSNNFISKIESYLTFVKISQEERKKIAQMFNALDKNSNGTIELEELKLAYQKIDTNNNIDELEYIISKIDKNKSGKIDLSQFMAAIYDRRKLFVKDYLEEAFEYFDSNGTGFLEKQELYSLLERCQQGEIEQILHQIDINGDAKISKQEFLSYLLKRNFLFTKTN